MMRKKMSIFCNITCPLLSCGFVEFIDDTSIRKLVTDEASLAAQSRAAEQTSLPPLSLQRRKEEFEYFSTMFVPDFRSDGNKLIPPRQQQWQCVCRSIFCIYPPAQSWQFLPALGIDKFRGRYCYWVPVGPVGRLYRPNCLDRRGNHGDQGGMVMICSDRLNRPNRLNRLNRHICLIRWGD